MFFKILLIFLLFNPLLLAYREGDPSELGAPPKDYYISNPDSIISASDFESINNELKSFQKIQVGVLIIQKMSSHFLNQFSRYSQDEAAHQFAKTVFDQWGIGERSTNNGLLLFISTLDRKLRIVTGAGAQNFVTDSDSDSIFSEVKYLLKNEDYAGAIRGSLNEIKDYLNPSILRRIIKGILSILTQLMIPLIFIGVFCCIAALSALNPTNRKRNDFTKKIEKLKEMQKSGKLNENFVNGTCGICLEDFEKKEKENPKTADFVILVCGHNFHKSCLEEWLKKKNICPFCKLKDPTNSNRDPFRNNDDEYEKLNEEVPSQNNNNGVDRNIDILHRMVMIQRLRYPEFYNDYSFSYGGGNSFSYRDVRPQPTYSHSSGGSSSSFGGGSSRGGGGGGGSW